MKKILIYYPQEKLRPQGGPAGYLFNLKCGLEKCSNGKIKIDFISQKPKTIESNSTLRRATPMFLKDIRRAIKFSSYLNRKNPIESYLYDYDAIHFHSTEDMYLCRDSLETYKGKVILTSHSPCALHKEILARIKPFYYKLLRRKLDRLEEMDSYAFNRANYIIFPCEEAEEPYYNTWKNYAFLRDASKLQYLPTGIEACKAKLKRDDIRNKYNIPKEAFLIAYVGRHNEIKGYGDLKKIGKALLNYPDIYFIVAGKEEPLKGIEHKRWIEIGWTDDPHSVIAAADVFWLPNRETYFDLVMLEVLSLGKVVIASRTGGNKFFEKYNLPSILEYDTQEEAMGIIDRLLKLEKYKLEEFGRENRDLFNKNFTADVFAKRYVDIIEKILE